MRRNRPRIGLPRVKGNHDEQASLLEPSRGFNELAEHAINWTRENLTEADKEWLRELRLPRQVRDFTIVHATLDSPAQWGYVLNNLDAAASFTYQHTTVCFFGHTHVPVVYRARCRRATAAGRSDHDRAGKEIFH